MNYINCVVIIDVNDHSSIECGSKILLTEIGPYEALCQAVSKESGFLAYGGSNGLTCIININQKQLSAFKDSSRTASTQNNQQNAQAVFTPSTDCKEIEDSEVGPIQLNVYVFLCYITDNSSDKKLFKDYKMFAAEVIKLISKNSIIDDGDKKVVVGTIFTTSTYVSIYDYDKLYWKKELIDIFCENITNQEKNASRKFNSDLLKSVLDDVTSCLNNCLEELRAQVEKLTKMEKRLPASN
ncbi:hypothetical protein COEREDRAFT_89509 [Coemansia reversa NRRL 1564]|uniref:Uncharacterized protein n=1 Tax=Coemansia reversa (strain ATCC 12441 / NRRL 1564) TaxID=763665 RepID=A0A2G5B3F8_COERN|nr:hypothetical protein COEREDRAFT_89509 [Coemansia reversa NRRL 1564]|eukprot:PIA13536.1 hypothetical protein COEREDRAFT_89509 [Coemansia reversa NRRL 1564]